MAVSYAWLLTLISGEEHPVRIRSALLFDLGAPDDFTFPPEQVPPTFLVNKGAVLPEFQQAGAQILERVPSPRSEFAVGLAIAQYLMQAPTQKGNAIGGDLLTTLSAITTEGRGYCADFTKVFNGLAIATSLPVRQWGFSFDAFGSGHTFNEIYDRARNKWILVDSFHSLYFVDGASGDPLSTIEVHDALLALPPTSRTIAIERIVPDRFPFRSEEIALDYYRRGMQQLFLDWGNNVFDYETTLAFRATHGISRSAEQLFSIALGHYPRMRVYPIGLSDREVYQLQEHWKGLRLSVGAALLATVLFLLQVPSFFRRSARGDVRSGA